MQSVRRNADLSGGAAPPDRSALRTPSQAFSNFFNAYSRGFNKSKLRTGALFERPFKRIKVTTEAYFIRLITYIHQNPQKHGFVKDFRDWNWSSYQALVINKPTRLQRDDVMTWFGGLSQFVESHRLPIQIGDMAMFVPEDFD